MPFMQQFYYYNCLGQYLFEAFYHIEYQYALCNNCFVKALSMDTKNNQFQRISLLIDNHNKKLKKCKKINNDLIYYLRRNINKILQYQNNQLKLIDQYFNQQSTSFKSSISDLSTNQTNDIEYKEIQEKQNQYSNKNIQQKIQGKLQKTVNFITKNSQQTYSIVKSKINQKSNQIYTQIQKFKQNQKTQKHLENIDCYKNKIIQKTLLKKQQISDKFNYFKGQFKNIKAELPEINIKQTLKNVQLPQFFKNKFFKWK